MCHGRTHHRSGHGVSCGGATGRRLRRRRRGLERFRPFSWIGIGWPAATPIFAARGGTGSGQPAAVPLSPADIRRVSALANGTGRERGGGLDEQPVPLSHHPLPAGALRPLRIRVWSPSPLRGPSRRLPRGGALAAGGASTMAPRSKSPQLLRTVPKPFAISSRSHVNSMNRRATGSSPELEGLWGSPHPQHPGPRASVNTPSSGVGRR